MLKKPVDAVDYLFSIAGTVHGPPDQLLEHDHYLYVTYHSDDDNNNTIKARYDGLTFHPIDTLDLNQILNI